MSNNSNFNRIIFSYTLLWRRFISLLEGQAYLSRCKLRMNTTNYHANGASFFFVCLYLHIGRGLYYGSYVFIHTWLVGVIILFMVIATAFLGYVLP